MRFLLGFFLLLAVAAPVAAQPAAEYVRVPVNVSIWRGVSLGDALASDTSRRVLHHVSLNLPAGRADRLEGVAVGVFSTVYEESAYGIQIAGLANVAGEDAAGLQAAGLANVTGETFTGFQVAGLANVVGERGGYLQAAGLANVAGERFQGVQAAGLANVAGERLSGIQAAGFANISGEDTRGGQLAGFANIAGEAMEGFQAAGFANIAGEAMRGVQAAGLANVAGENVVGIQAASFNVAGGTVHGAQLGLANVSGETGGLQIGLVNVAGEEGGVPVGLYSRVADVPVRLDIWTDETAALHVGVRSGSEAVSNYTGVSVRPFADAALRWGVFAGLGVEGDLAPRTAWGVDAFVHGLFEDDLGGYGGTLLRLRAIATRFAGRRTAFFAGPALNLFIGDGDDGDSLAPLTLWDDGDLRLWPGIEAGLRLRLAD